MLSDILDNDVYVITSFLVVIIFW